MSTRPRGKRTFAGVAVVLLAVGVVVAAGVGGMYAGRHLAVPEVVQEQVAPTVYTVGTATLGHVETVVVEASWPTLSSIYAVSEGVLTYIGGDTLNVGEELWRINERSAIVILGDLPPYRDIEAGDTGDDVRQLQRFLSEAGVYAGESDGKFGARTRRAVAQWDRSIGNTPKDQVLLGDLVVTNTLGHRLVHQVKPGDPVAPGGRLADVLADIPRFVVRVERATADVIVKGAPVSLSVDGETIELVVSDLVVEADGRQIAILVPSGGCDACQAVPLSGSTTYTGRIVRVPETTGPSVPLSAIVTTPNGGRTVTMADGRIVDVAVVAEHGGVAVVDGLHVGDQVVLPDWVDD